MIQSDKKEELFSLGKDQGYITYSQKCLIKKEYKNKNSTKQDQDQKQENKSQYNMRSISYRKEEDK